MLACVAHRQPEYDAGLPHVAGHHCRPPYGSDHRHRTAVFGPCPTWTPEAHTRRDGAKGRLVLPQRLGSPSIIPPGAVTVPPRRISGARTAGRPGIRSAQALENPAGGRSATTRPKHAWSFLSVLCRGAESTMHKCARIARCGGKAGGVGPPVLFSLAASWEAAAIQAAPGLARLSRPLAKSFVVSTGDTVAALPGQSSGSASANAEAALDEP